MLKIVFNQFFSWLSNVTFICYSYRMKYLCCGRLPSPSSSNFPIKSLKTFYHNRFKVFLSLLLHIICYLKQYVIAILRFFFCNTIAILRYSKEISYELDIPVQFIVHPNVILSPTHDSPTFIIDFFKI